jgi:hypothetical protein
MERMPQFGLTKYADQTMTPNYIKITTSENYSYNKGQQDALFLNFILVYRYDKCLLL